MAFAMVFWNLDLFSLSYFEDLDSAVRWSTLARTGVCLAPVSVLHLALVLSGSRGRLWRAVLASTYAQGILLAYANLRGELVAGLIPHPWGWYPRPLPLYWGLNILIVGALAAAAERTWYAYRHPSSSRQLAQTKFWLFAWAVQMPLALTNLLPVYGFGIYPLGSLGNVAASGIVAYAIVRHRLMDAGYVVRKVVSFSLAAGAVLLPGTIALGALLHALNTPVPAVFICAASALTLSAAVLVPRLEEALETRVHQALFPNLYDCRRALGQLAAGVVHILDQNELVRRLGSTLSEVLNLETCDVFVRDEGTSCLEQVYPAPSVGETERSEQLGNTFAEIRAPVLTSELAATPHARYATLAAIFQARRWEVGIPLRAKDQLLGFVALGPRRDLRIFSAEDLQLLDTVAAGAAVALENARLSRQLRQSESALERASRLSSVGMLAAGIAHEIRNPLVAVKTFLDLLPDRLNDLEFLQSFRLLSLSELRRVTDLINDMLALGKSPTPEHRTLELQPTLEPVVRLMASTAHKRQVEVTSQFTPDLPRVSADANQLKQILLNLLLNAIESCVSGGHVSVTVRAVVAASPDSHRVILEIRDDGPGIPSEHLQDIFHPFFTTKETGTGLGLALVHQMVLEHGGEITVESQVGHGSVFRVSLPAADAATASPTTLARTGT
jgi:signal transduction histidine kinase